MIYQPLIARMIRSLLVALMLIAIGSIGSYVILQQSLHEQRAAVLIVNLSGRQRMLSQRIALVSLRLVASADQQARAAQRRELSLQADQMLEAHNALSVGNPALGIMPPTAALREVYMGGSPSLDSEVRRYVAHAHGLSSADDSALTAENTNFIALQQRETSLLAGLDAIVGQQQAVTVQLIETQHHREGIVLLIMLIALALVGLVMIRPIVRQVAFAYQEVMRLRQQLSAALDTAGEAILMLDAQRVVTVANREAQALFRGNVIGLPIDRMLPDFVALAPPHVRTTMSGMRIDNSLLPLEVTVTPTEIDQEIHLTLALRDLSSRYELENARRENEQRYETLVGSLVEGVVLQNADGSIVACNSSAERVLGLTADQMRGRSSIDPRWCAIHEDGSPFPGEAHPAMLALHTGAQQNAVVMGVMKPNGDLTWILINAQPLIRPTEQQPYAVVCSFFDITEQRRYEQQVRFQKTLLECQSEASPDGILVVSPMHKWLYANERFATMWQLDAQVMAAAASDVGVPAMATQLANAEQVLTEMDALYRDRNASGHSRLVFNDGRVFERYSAPVCDANGTYYGRVWYFRDVSERDLADRAKQEFVAVVSHELRTPLTSIRGALSIVASGSTGELPERARGMLEIAHKNSERLIRLINDILDIEKIESDVMPFVMEPLVLTPLISQALAANQALATPSDVTLMVTPPTHDIWVYADSDRLMQVFANLLSNAIKFSPRGGVVQVELAASATKVRVSVNNQGEEIPPAFQPRIFEKFVQADSSDTRRRGGSGLGLSITRAIVERHSGIISFHSVAGDTTFTVELPILSNASPAPTRPSTTEQPPRLDNNRRRPQLLHVEDDNDLVRVTTSLFQDIADVTHSATLAAAHATLEQRQFDVILLDLLLTDGLGVDLLPVICRSAPPPPVVIFSINDTYVPQHAAITTWLVKSRTSDQQLLRIVTDLIAAYQRAVPTQPTFTNQEQA